MENTTEALSLLDRVMKYLVYQRLQASLRQDWGAYQDYTDAMYFIDKFAFKTEVLGDLSVDWKHEFPKKVVTKHGNIRYKKESK